MKDSHESAPPPKNFDIPIFQKTYDFYKDLYIAQVKFPKSHKYTLGQKLDNTTLLFFELLMTASQKNQSESREKLTNLTTASTKLEILKVLLRLAKDTQSLDNKSYLRLQSHLQEIGRMLGGWIKHTKQTV